MRLPVAIVAAAVSGLLLLVSFPLYNLWFLAPFGVALFAVAVHGRRLRAGFGLGMITGLVFFGPLLDWTNMHVGKAPWILLTLYQAVYIGLLGLALAWVSPLNRRIWPVGIALLWTAQEALRDRFPFGGFPWGRLAFSQGDSPALRFASLGGAPLVTFVVALAGGLLALTVIRPYSSRLATGGSGGLAEGDRSPETAGRRTVRPGLRVQIASVVGAAAIMFSGLLIPLSAPDGQPVTVAVVQGNVPRLGLEFNAQRKAVLENHANATKELAERVKADPSLQPDLVVWPENASDIDPLVNLDAALIIEDAVRAINAPVLVGAVLRGPGEGESRNAGIVYLPDGTKGGMYLKQHPVPFAEYLPMRPIVEPIAKLITDKAKLLRSDFIAGTDPAVLTMGPARVGDVICFEVAYDELVRDAVRHGAQLLTVQTNNATFNTSEAEQQLAMVRLRAVEHGRDSLMASTVGISAFVSTDGTVHDATGFNTQATIVRQLHTNASTTLATRLGVWPEVVLVVLALGVLIAAGKVRRPRGDAERHEEGV